MSFTRQQLEDAGLGDFRVFLRQVWDFLRLPAPTAVQNDIAWHLQHGGRRQIICAFRGVGKSWITTAFVLWVLLLNPEAKILVVSANQQLADDFSKFAKQLIHGMPLLQHLAPRLDQRNSAISFDVGPARPSKDPSVKSAGITGQITGSRADIIIADDIEIPKNSYTQLLRSRLAELVKEFDAILKPGGRIVYLGTPQIEASLYNVLANDRGYRMTVWPVEIPEEVDRYNGRLAQLVLNAIASGMVSGDPLDAARFSRADLDERLASYGRTGYALQFMLDTSPSDAERYPLKMRDALVTDVDETMGWVKLVWASENQYRINDLPIGGIDGDYLVRPAYRADAMAPFTGTVMAIDPSGTGKDETAYCIARLLHGVVYIVASGGFRDGFSEVTLANLAALAARYRVNEIVVERNFGGGMFTTLLKGALGKVNPATSEPLHRCKVEEVWHTGMKEARILDVLEPVFQSHKIVFDRRVIEEDAKVQRETPHYSLVYQATRLARLKGALANDDRVEALYMAVAHFTAKLGRDQDRALEDHHKAAFEEELRRFMHEGIRLSGKPVPKPSRKVAGRRRW